MHLSNWQRIAMVAVLLIASVSLTVVGGIKDSNYLSILGIVADFSAVCLGLEAYTIWRDGKNQ